VVGMEPAATFEEFISMSEEQILHRTGEHIFLIFLLSGCGKVTIPIGHFVRPATANKYSFFEAKLKHPSAIAKTGISIETVRGAPKMVEVLNQMMEYCTLGG